MFLSALAAGILTGSAFAVPVTVVNPGFETGDFSGWTPFGNFILGANVDINVNPFAPGPIHEAAFGNAGSVAGISQDLATVAGHNYQVTFFLDNTGGSKVFFQSVFGSVNGTTLNAVPPGGYMQFSYLATASSAITELSFTFMNDVSSWFLDEISVEDLDASAGAPEVNGGTALLPFLFIAAGLGLVSSRKRALQKSFRVSG